MDKLRLFFEKTGLARFLSHLDINRAFLRALLAADVPVRYSEGFNPHPRIVFGQPLPLGVAGLCEPLDVLVRAPVELAGLAERLSAFLPSGLRAVQAVLPQRDLKEITWAAYETSMPASCAAAFESFWGQPSVVTLKKSKRGAREIDLKQLAARMETQPGPDMLVVRYMLPCSSDGSVGPVQLADAFAAYAGQTPPMSHTRTGFYAADFSPFR